MKKRLLLCLLGLSLMACEKKTYQVQVIYCDARPPKRMTVSRLTAEGPPDRSMISTYKQAVPVYFDELNVCDVKIISEVTTR